MKVMTVVGARPQFVKAALVSEELKRRGHREVLVHSGQHYDYNMSEAFFKQLSLPRPDYHLDVGSASHAAQTGRMMERLEPLVIDERPDFVLVYGDTNTTLAAAIVAAKLAVPLAHVEAGLRSFNRTMPEEINRIVADHLSALHFVPHRRAADQLAREGISNQVQIVGDLMVDLLRLTLASLPGRPTILDDFRLIPREYAVATIHRASNVDDPSTFKRIVDGLRSIGVPVIFPVHPRSQKLVEHLGLGHKDDPIIISRPLPYREMIALQKDARVILTDSGGMQKEAYVLGVPCVTLREETEWVETLEDDWNQLVGSDPIKIQVAARRQPRNAQRADVYGDGTAARKITDALALCRGGELPVRLPRQVLAST